MFYFLSYDVDRKRKYVELVNTIYKFSVWNPQIIYQPVKTENQE